jgi:hypothetical protein
MTIVVAVLVGLLACLILWIVLAPGKAALIAALRKEPDAVSMSKFCEFYVVTYHGHSELFFPWQKVPEEVLRKVREAASYRQPGLVKSSKKPEWSVKK